jgi:hypothetical protein
MRSLKTEPFAYSLESDIVVVVLIDVGNWKLLNSYRGTIAAI